MLMLQRFLLHGCLFLLTFELSSWVLVFKLSLMCPVAIMGLFTGQPQMILWAGTHKPIINSKWSPHSISITSPLLCGPTKPVFWWWWTQSTQREPTRIRSNSTQKGLLELGIQPRSCCCEAMELTIINIQTNPVSSRGQKVYPRLNEGTGWSSTCWS